MTKIKLCGISRPEDIMAVNQWKPDYIGFVFYKKKCAVCFSRKRQKIKGTTAAGDSERRCLCERSS